MIIIIIIIIVIIVIIIIIVIFIILLYNWYKNITSRRLQTAKCNKSSHIIVIVYLRDCSIDIAWASWRLDLFRLITKT